MIPEERIRRELKNTIRETNLPALGRRETGKVRDSYLQKEKRILIATDRISAFDRVLGTIPFKGQVLNQLAAFWFEQTKHLVPNHILDVPDPNVMAAAECEQLPLEIIVRGYITGVTKTSLWFNYQQGVRNYCGHVLPEGLRKDQKLDKPIVTPTTKLESHDRPVSRAEVVREGLVTAEIFDKAADICLKLFDYGTKFAHQRGLILVDTKYELGFLNGKLAVSDEIHTPDSSRYWFAGQYEELFAAGKDQRKLDKEYVREWFAARGFRGEGAPPAMPDEIRIEAAKRYIQAYEIITGREFVATEEPPLERMERNLRDKGYMK
ncbi:MAG: phosphoribosylaminoimidazolesuccinocarboxamide synthase [Kiritimatiellae bacterium]|jgi:phosphoribosylaminoimidazole-succinocarboxamide synthase|nr:phosphoribosylaminoimidazolesuccinocarboxamide synthase [Kiritimatiellia bacterium]